MTHRLQAQKHRDTRGRRIKQEKHFRLSMVFNDIIRRSLSYFKNPGAHFVVVCFSNKICGQLNHVLHKCRLDISACEHVFTLRYRLQVFSHI